MSLELVSVADAPSQGLAEVMAGKLRAHGIEASVNADNCGGAYPPLSGYKVLVPHAEAVRSRWILSQGEGL